MIKASDDSTEQLEKKTKSFQLLQLAHKYAEPMDDDYKSYLLESLDFGVANFDTRSCGHGEWLTHYYSVILQTAYFVAM